MNGLNVMTVIPGRNNVPGVYSSNFDPTAYSTMPMLTRLAIGSILIQNANFDSVTCTETCTLALWIKTCLADCADSTWQSINLGPVVLPPDVHCVAGSLTAGNILVLNLNDGSQIQVDLSALAAVLVDGTTITGDGLAIPLKAGNLIDNNNGTYTWTDASGATFNLPKTVAAKMWFSGTLGPIAPNVSMKIPFTSMDYNIGGAGALGAAPTFTAPYNCLVHVDAFAFFSFEAWNSAGSVAASVAVFKNGLLDTLLGADYSIKGGNIVSGTPNEFKTPSGGTDVLCAAGDVLEIQASNGQSSGSSHNVFNAYANFHVVGAV